MEVRRKDKDLKGWLRRKGKRMNTWSRRWVVLKDKVLFLFMREEDAKWQTCISLDGQIIIEPAAEPGDPRGYFDIINESDKNPSESLSLCAETDEEKKIWVRALKRALYADKGGALFSQSLEEILLLEKTAGRHIPYIVDECVEYLYKYGLDVEGIFRLPGRQSAIKDIIARFERGEKIQFEEEGTDIHVVASVLKTFLRDLPDSIIPCRFFQKFMNIAMHFMDMKSEEEKEPCIQDLKEAMKLLPADNYTILKYICNFLRKLGLNEGKNKMSMMSLGIVFGYNIIRHIDKENSQLFLCTADLGQHLVYMLLNYYPELFTLEYNDAGKEENNVATADLLRMSRVIDVPAALPVAPAPCGAIADLQGLSFNLTSPTTSSKGSDGSIRITDDYFSPVEAPQNISESDDTGISDDCVFVSSADFVHDKKKKLHLNLQKDGGLVRSQSTPSSPNAKSGTPPIPPRRAKSKITRNRNVSDRRRPEIYTDGGDKSPRTPESVNCEDVLTALSNITTSVSDTVTSNPDCNLSQASSEPVHDNITGTVMNTHEVSRQETHEDSATGNGKLAPSTDDLRHQVLALKEELVRQRERYKSQVSALKSQLTEMREKYEQRIKTVEAEFTYKNRELESRLEIEKSARAAAVETTVKLREEIHRYQMQYGDLSS